MIRRIKLPKGRILLLSLNREYGMREDYPRLQRVSSKISGALFSPLLNIHHYGGTLPLLSDYYQNDNQIYFKNRFNHLHN